MPLNPIILDPTAPDPTAQDLNAAALAPGQAPPRPGGRVLRSAEALAGAGLVAADEIAAIADVGARYAIAVTPDMAALMEGAGRADPIARQFIPDPRELENLPQERADPIGDDAHTVAPGVVHRYPDRVLLQPVKVCPVYCRFCFRRETVGPGAQQTLAPEDLDAAFAYIGGRPEIWEVILTGGDPLGLSPRRMRALMGRLAEIAHVKVVRIHTRVPAVDPSRVTDAMIEALRACGKTVYVALHANHPREMTEAARAACARLIDAGIAMVSQSVLLKGVNDDVGVLADLMRCFVENRIKPYYLHHPDLAPGTAHFRLSIAEGQALVAQLRGRVSGLAQPQYVIDIPGGYGKSPASAAQVAPLAHDAREGDGVYALTDWRGAVHVYADDVDPRTNRHNGRALPVSRAENAGDR